MNCSSCKTSCAAPQACHQPEPRPKSFRPTFDLTGPWRRRRLGVRRWPLVSIVGFLLVLAVTLALFFLVRYR